MGTPLKYRAKSPGHALLLTPNDDETERAQVRQARAAALRRKSGFGSNVGAAISAAAAQEESNVLSREHILELHNNCIKLAAENVSYPWIFFVC
jgi:condensin complex subunit 2